jgi:hypothetical protein
MLNGKRPIPDGLAFWMEGIAQFMLAAPEPLTWGLPRKPGPRTRAEEALIAKHRADGKPTPSDDPLDIRTS